MRNLKKILALALALVMSLSLMATAGAAETTAAETGSKYQTAIDVLKGVEVVKGDENGDRPADPITRAEVAALLYRIATGDVKDTQAAIHTGQGFTDVNANDWYAGYISYCYIGEIIKGNPNGTFEPDNNINGYATLAMILRAMGYGKNGEFEGDGWEIRTASTAKQIGILDGIVDTQLSGNATRELVFEILFRAIFKDMVKFDAREPFVYPSTGENLAKKNLGLEAITGIVMANEYADLEDADTLADGKTRMNVDGTNYTLNVTTDLTDIGESRTAYVKKTTQNSFNLVVDQLYGNDNNVRAESGDETKVSTLAGTENLSLSGAEYFINFGEDELYNRSDYRISYLVSSITRWTTNSSRTQADFVASLEEDYGIDVDVANDTITGPTLSNGNYYFTWTVKKGEEARARISIAPGDEITAWDRSCIQDIFYYAGLEKADAVDEYGDVVLGEVYVGTQYTKDISDTMSYRDFVDTYLKTASDYQYFTESDNGDWLKIIDNNSDGIAEYVFKTYYGLAEVTGYNTRGDYFTFSADGTDAHGGWVINLASGGDGVNYLNGYEPAIGDLVLAAYIDGKWQIEEAPMETKTIKTVSYKDKTVTTTEDDTWDQSDEWNWTVYLDQILEMNEKTEYEIFFDHFNHIRAYREVEGQTNYALLSELYYTNNWNGKFIKNTNPIVEITMGEEETVELPANSGNAFEGAGRTYVDGRNSYIDYLQRAISHLGYVPSNYNTTNTNAYDSNIGDNWVTSSTSTAAGNAASNGDEYTWTADNTVSVTNVAKYTLSDDGESVSVGSAAVQYVDRYGDAWYYSDINANGGTTVTTADKVTKATYAERYEKKNGAGSAISGGSYTAAFNAAFALLTPVYAVDYVQLAIEDIKKGASAYTIDESDVSAWDRGNVTAAADKAAWKGNYVNAVHDTEYYIVGMGDGKTPGSVKGIRYFTDYAELPAIDKDDITAIYAVATNTTADVTQRDYWVADVVVIETTGQVKNWDSVSLAYYNPLKSTGNVRDLLALDSQTEDPSVTLVPKDQTSWGNQWQNYWFYELYDTEVTEPSIAASNIIKIEEDYNDHGIYAGRATRSVEVLGRGSYVMVDQGANYSKDTKLTVGEVPVYGIVWNNTDTGRYPTYSLIELATSEIRSGDELIWVTNKDGGLKYIVISNISYSTHAGQLTRNEISPSWLLNDLYDDIIDDQNAVATDTIRFNLHLGVGDALTLKVGDADAVPYPTTGTITTANTYTMSVKVNKDSGFVRIVVGGLTEAADLPNIVIPAASDWQIEGTPTWNDTAKTWNFSISRKDKNVLSLTDSDAPVDVAIYTRNAITAIVDLLASDDAEVAAAAKATLTELAPATLKVDGTPVSTAAADAIGAANTEEAAAALVEKYDAWAVLPLGPAKDTALNNLIQAAADYKTAAGTAPTEAGDVKTAYDATVDEIDSVVKAVVDASTNALATTAAAITLGAIKTANEKVDVVKALPNSALDLATWSNAATGNVTKAEYTEKVTAIEGKENLLTVAKTLVETYDAYYDATQASPAPTQSVLDNLFAAFRTAAEAVDALTPALNKSIVTESTMDTLLGGVSGDPTPATAYTYWSSNPPVDAAISLSFAPDTYARWESATSTVIIVPDASAIDATSLKALFATDANIKFEKDDGSQGTWSDLTFEAGSAANTWTTTLKGIKGGQNKTVTLTVRSATTNDLVNIGMEQINPTLETLKTNGLSLANTATYPAITAAVVEAVEGIDAKNATWGYEAAVTFVPEAQPNFPGLAANASCEVKGTLTITFTIDGETVVKTENLTVVFTNAAPIGG